MKKIAIFSLALAFLFAGVGVASAASCTITNNKGDDSRFFCGARHTSSFSFSNSQSAVIKTTQNTTVKTGGNYITAGDDVNNASITSGDANVTVVNNSDVNSTDVVFKSSALGGGETVTIDGNNGADQTISGFASDSFTTSVSDSSSLNETETTNTTVASGNNGVSGGDDVNGTSVTSGDTNVKTKNVKYRNFKVFRFR